MSYTRFFYKLGNFTTTPANLIITRMTKQGGATIKNTAEKIVNSRISEFFQIVDNKIIAIIATQCEKWVLCKVEHLCIYSFKSVNSMYFYCMHAII